MVIGLLGGGEEYRAFMTAMKQNHEGMTNCGDLLKKNAELVNKKPHCDGMVHEAVENVVKVRGYIDAQQCGHFCECATNFPTFPGGQFSG